MSRTRILKWITGGLEAFLGIPFVGAVVVIGTSYVALAVMLVLHIVTLILTKEDRGQLTGSILGIITSFIGWIPFVGMVMHILSAVFLMINAAANDRETIVINNGHK